MGTPRRSPSERESFDAIVIGSGFGGSVLTYRLSHGGMRVCLLERGRAYAPGEFARGVAQTQQNFWSPDRGLHGLFDVWSFRRMVALVSSGLGGGSLIYANVLLRKPEEWFASTTPGGEPWPVSFHDLVPHYEAVETMLGARPYPTELSETTPKTRAFYDAADKYDPFLPNLAITFAAPGREGEQFDDGAGNRYGAPRFGCRLVGECDVGCNLGAKNTLDLTYLSALADTAEVRVRCEAKTLARDGSGYAVEYVDHARGGRRVSVRAPRVVLAAGALGSTYLLLKNADALGGLSDRLGHRFSGNGDVLTFAIGAREHGRPRVIDPTRGPVITAAARVDDPDGRGRDMFLEDGGGPSAASWVAEMIEAPRLLLRALRFVRKAFSRKPVREIGADLSALLSSNRIAAHSLPLLGMGRDRPVGRLILTDGLLDLRWEGDVADYYDRAHDVSKTAARKLGARFSDLAYRLNHHVTAHPLGGCPMGDSPATGVVDPFGRVYGHELGLYVVDGAAMPGPVGANPSLTIAAFANRAATKLLAEA